MKPEIRIRPNGDKEWYLNGLRHREDGPAHECANSYYKGWYKSWWMNGQLHREDGPAREWQNGSKEWWINGVLVRSER